MEQSERTNLGSQKSKVKTCGTAKQNFASTLAVSPHSLEICFIKIEFFRYGMGMGIFMS
jgi:hypothetical protein